MKWLLSVTLVAIVAAAIWWQINTTHIAYVNGLDAYAAMPNREYILEHDCYVFSPRQHIATAHPLLGLNAPGVPTSYGALPVDVTPDNIGKVLPTVRLMDVIPKGTRFRILSVRSEESRRAGLFLSYEIIFLDDVQRPYPRIDIRPILLPVAHPGDVPKIDPTVAVPWIKR